MFRVFKWEEDAASLADHENPAFFVESSEEMRELFAAVRKQRKEHGSDVAAAEATELTNDAVRSIIRQSFYDTEAQEMVQRVYEEYCAASPDISHATVITYNYMASKMRAIFGFESSFWKPVLAVRVIGSAKDMEELVSTLSPIACISEMDLLEKMLQAMDDTDFFFAAVQSPAVEDVFTESLPEISVFFSLHCTELPGSTTPVVCLDSWLALNMPMFDINYSSSIAESIFFTMLCRSRNMLLQKDVESVATFRAKILVRSHDTDAMLAKEGLDADCFCEALAVVASIKFPSPFTPLEQKIWPFIHSYLNPLMGVKSKDMKRKVVGGGDKATDLKSIRPTNISELVGYGDKKSSSSPRTSPKRTS
jgi:hypothetical protein